MIMNKLTFAACTLSYSSALKLQSESLSQGFFDFLDPVGDFFENDVGGFFEDVADGIGEAFEDVGDWFENDFVDFWEDDFVNFWEKDLILALSGTPELSEEDKQKME